MWNLEEEASRLATRFEAVKNRAAFARQHGLKGGGAMIYQHINGLKPISLSAAEAYARGFNCSLAEISPRLAAQVEQASHRLSPSSYSINANGKAESYPNELEEAPALRPGRNVPVVGEVQGGVDGYLLELEYPVGHGDGFVPYYGLDRNAYALRVRGDSMHPRYRAGEFVVVEPNVEPQPQDDVVVCLVGGQKMLKMLNWISTDEAQFLSINDDHKPLTIPLLQIERMHRVNGHVPRSAFIRV